MQRLRLNIISRLVVDVHTAFTVMLQARSSHVAADVAADRRRRMAAMRSSDPHSFLPQQPVAFAADTGASSSLTDAESAARALAATVVPPVGPTSESREARRQRKAESSFSRQVKQSSQILGSGAFGVVYLGIHQGNGSWIAIKKMNLRPQGTAIDGTAVKSQLDELVDEIRLMKALEHTNIVKYLHAEHNEAELSIFMEYMSGGSLVSLLKKFDVLSEPLIRVYMTQAIQGVAYLHQRNVVHRDIKADNILLSADGTAKLSDFGTSREVSESANLLTVTGTPWFMAPEVVKGTGHGAAADMWSLGCTMIQLARGTAPFSDFPNPVTAMYNVALHPQKVLEYIPATCSAVFRDCLEWCLRENPGLRPTAVELLSHPFFAHAEGSDSSRSSSASASPTVLQETLLTNTAAGATGGLFQAAPLGPKVPTRPTTPTGSLRVNRIRAETQNQQTTSAVAVYPGS